MNEPQNQSGLWTRLFVCLFGVVIAVVLTWLLMLTVTAQIHWLLIIYAFVLLAPLLRCAWLRGLALWREGFKLLPKGQGRRLYGWTFIAFISLFVLIQSLELWRGKWAYARLKRDVAAKGEKVEFASIIPPPVPDEQNFCATPLLAPLLDYKSKFPFDLDTRNQRDPAGIRRALAVSVQNGKKALDGSWMREELTDLSAWQTYFATPTAKPPHWPVPPSGQSQNAAADVLLALTKFDVELKELHAANERPHARWPLHYENGWFGSQGTPDRDECLVNLVGVLKLRTSAELAAGQSDAALRDVKLAFRLADTIQSEPSLFSHRHRNELLEAALQPVWEGLATRRWSDAQLAELQARLSQFDLMGDARRVMRSEARLWMEFCRQMGDILSVRFIVAHFGETKADGATSLLVWGLASVLYPSGWAYQDRVFIYRLYESDGDLRRHPMPVDPAFTVFVLPKVRQMIQDNTQGSFNWAHLSLQEALVACALERHRLAQGNYPDALDILAPRFLDKLPSALDGNGPLLGYRRTADGQFILFPAWQTNVPDQWKANPADDNHRTWVIRRGDGAWRYPGQ